MMILHVYDDSNDHDETAELEDGSELIRSSSISNTVCSSYHTKYQASSEEEYDKLQ